MKCPHCSREIKPKGPDCPRCGQRIFGTGGALDQTGQAQPQPTAPADPTPRPAPSPATKEADDALAADFAAVKSPSTGPKPKDEASAAGLAAGKVKDLDVDGDLDLDSEDAFHSAVTQVREAEEDAGRATDTAQPDLGYSQVDLDDGAEGADSATRAAQGRETLESDGSIALRRETAARERAASELYDESLMGGLYIGALVGGAAGYLKARGQEGVWGWTIGGAAACALIGLIAGFAAGKGAGAGVRTQRGQRLLIGLGLVLIAAPIIGIVVKVTAWGYTTQRFWAACTHFVIAFGCGALTFQDARRRRMDGAGMWGAMVGILPPLYGLYASRRPHGPLVPCGGASCDKMYLAALGRCPHCGYVSRAGVREELVEL